jgi:hypothetical protein
MVLVVCLLAVVKICTNKDDVRASSYFSIQQRLLEQ